MDLDCPKSRVTRPAIAAGTYEPQAAREPGSAKVMDKSRNSDKMQSGLVGANRSLHVTTHGDSSTKQMYGRLRDTSRIETGLGRRREERRGFSEEAPMMKILRSDGRLTVELCGETCRGESGLKAKVATILTSW